MPRRTLAELTRIAVSMVAQENLDSDETDKVLAQRILTEADPLFVDELGRALAHQRLVLWIQSERRKAQRRTSAKHRGDKEKAG